MSRLLKKNILLNKRNILFGIIGAFLFGLISHDGHQYYIVAMMMCPALLFTFVVGKMCYVEDSIATQQFLLSLPISKWDIIFEKDILSYLCILIGVAIANIMSFLFDIIQSREVYFDIHTIIITFIFLIIYNTTYIGLNYKYDYSKTQFTPYILLALMLVLFKFGKQVMEIVHSSNFLLLLGLCIAAILLNYGVLIQVCKNCMKSNR